MSRKRKLNKKKLLGFILCIILIIFFSYFVIDKLGSNKNNSDIESKKENIKENDKISLIMVGDNLIHDKIYKEASRNAGGNGYDFKPMYEYIKPIVSDYDIAYYNQETILGGSDIGVSSYPAFNSPYEVGDAMIDAGFNLVSLATNHTLDRGEKAILNSRNYWNSRDNVLAVGSYSSMEERNEVQIRETNNITYTMLNYTYGTNGIKVPSGKEYLVNVWPCIGNNPDNDNNYQEYKNTIKEDIDRVRDKVDVLMVAMHWGIEYEFTPNSYQHDMAEFLADNGVDIIIGTHPHVVQPITYIGDTLVIYSLGNFASAHEVVNTANRVGLMVSLDIEKDSNTNKISINNLESELLYMYYTKDYTDFKIIPFSMINSNYLSNYEEVYNKYKNIVISLDNNIKIKELSNSN
ncbi:MAG: CapA family protein [Bacilli bacterium]